jgi:hypothetical protein
LFLRSTADYQLATVKAFQGIGALFDVDTTVVDCSSPADILKAVRENTGFDYIYVAAHGCDEGFGEKHGSLCAWTTLATEMCIASTLKDGGVLLLGCCDGGVKRVALTIFSFCSQIRLVCGPKWKLDESDAALAYHVFLHAHSLKQVSPSAAAARMTGATAIDFEAFDRFELDTDVILYQLRLQADDVSAQAQREDAKVV